MDARHVQQELNKYEIDIRCVVVTEAEKMSLIAIDIAEEKREGLKRCLEDAFPEVVGEDVVNFEQLRRVLGKRAEADQLI